MRSSTLQRVVILSALILVGAGTPALGQGSPKPSRSMREMDKRIRDRIARFTGKVFLFAKNLDTGETYGVDPDARVRTASTIKFPIMVEAFAQVAEGKLKWTDEVVLKADRKVQGSGVLQELSDGLRLPVLDAVKLMIVLSDNTATNLVLDVVTADAVNARMEALGLKETRSLRKIGGGGESKARDLLDNAKKGIGVSTPREMVTLLEKVENGEVVSRDASRAMIEILKHQQYHDGIGRTLRDVTVANKTGALDHLRSDVGIVYTTRGRIAMAITCEDIPEVDYTDDNPGHFLIADVSKLLVDGLGSKK